MGEEAVRLAFCSALLLAGSILCTSAAQVQGSEPIYDVPPPIALSSVVPSSFEAGSLERQYTGPRPLMLVYELAVNESGRVIENHAVSSTGFEAVEESILRKLTFSKLKYKKVKIHWVSLVGLCFLEAPHLALPCAPNSGKSANETESYPGRILMIGDSRGDYQKQFRRVTVDPDFSDVERTPLSQGSVTMRAIVDRNGDVAFAKALSGEAILEQASLAAIRQWKYKPLLWNNHPVEVEFEMQFNYIRSGQPI